MTTTRRAMPAGSAALPGTCTVQAHPRPGAEPTVVLVHGAFADASGGNDVAARLIRDDCPVIAPANPLRGVASDSSPACAGPIHTSRPTSSTTAAARTRPAPIS